jgi:D-3-phosphoglycerate dehydrogenase
MKHKILVITPVKHINGVIETLESIGDVDYLEHPSYEDVFSIMHQYDAIYTNPNKSNVFISQALIDQGVNLKVICTASTGTNHIDTEYAARKKIPVLSLTEKRSIINKISSTAELAFALMIASLRKINQSWDSVQKGHWDYLPYIGRQINHLTIGVVGYGRLGRLFARYCNAFGAKILIYEPYKKIKKKSYQQVGKDYLLENSDVISLHVHVNDETYEMVNTSWFRKMKPDVTIINTARGDVVNETHLIDFLEANKKAFYATDVIADEVRTKHQSKFKGWAIKSNQVLITPHIGGMTKEAQEIAFNYAAKMLKEYFKYHGK